LKKILFTLLVAGFCGGLQAQPFTGDSLYFLRPADTMMVYNDVATGQILFDHYVAPGQTLYGVTKFYGLTLEDIYHLNPKLRSKYETGDKVRVAIPHSIIRAVPAPDSLAWFVPVYYRMRKGETLFGLYKRTLKLPNDEQLLALNPTLDPLHMSANQELAIGYLKLDGIPKELRAPGGDRRRLRTPQPWFA